MPIVEITIKKDIHKIACAEGEQEKVLTIANRLKEKIEHLGNSFPSAADKTLYLMASLMMIDEITDSNKISAEKNDYIAKFENFLDETSDRIEKLTQKLQSDT